MGPSNPTLTLYSTDDYRRTFSLQHRRPIMLRTSVPKPEILDSDDPVVIHDFVHHVSLFELIPCSVYDWGPANGRVPLEDASPSQAVTTTLGRFRGERLVTERQRFETLITQQWLRMFMWRQDTTSRAPSRLAGDLPVDVGKVVMRALGDVQPKYKDCHGIGLVSSPLAPPDHCQTG
ncbi:hypothetical protein IMZ48_19670 [Candidatus Bathyarchaeota archaeon]|nr:hypothetical protein [Candidatus Bathyarchaeota archaeon]